MNPRVFISYSHDSEPHKQAVLDLATRLRAGGVDVQLDQYVNGSPEQGWPRWMLDELEQATHVLCVCSPTYYRRFRGHEQPGKGRGVTWEGAFMTQELYDANSRNRRFIPVSFGEADERVVPEPLRGVTRYRVEAEFDQLYRAILGLAGVRPEPLGPLRYPPGSGDGNPGPSPGVPPVPPPPAPPAEPSAKELEEVFAEVVAAMEEALSAVPPVARFLCPDAPVEARLVEINATTPKIRHRFARGGADPLPVLQSIHQRLPTFRGPRHEWDALEGIAAGVLSLGLDRRWVWTWRRTAGDGPVVYPKFAGRVDLQGGKVRLLGALAAALAGGSARLEQVFGPLDDRRVPDLPVHGPAVALEDRRKELQRHFVRYVLGPSDDRDVESLDGEELRVLFGRVLGLLKLAWQVDRNPYYADGGRVGQLASDIQQHLGAQELLLFLPAESGSEADLIRNPVVCLSLLKRIHTHIQKHRPSA